MGSDKSADSVVKTARDLIRKKKLDDAIALLTRYVDAAPHDRNGYELLGMAYFMKKEYEPALSVFHNLTRADSSYAPGWVNLGAVQNVTGDHQGATRSLRKAIKSDRKSASAYYNLGIAQKALKMNSMAISAYKEAIKLDPRIVEAYVNLANIFIDMSNLTQAMRVVNDGLKQCPDSGKLKAIRQKATDKQDAKRQNSSPFGRLVNEEELAKKQIRTTRRELTDAQRIEERDNVKALGKTLRQLQEPVVEILDTTLHQQLHLLNMAAAQKDSRGDALAAFDEMTKVLGQLDLVRKKSADTIDEMKAQLERADSGV